MFDLTYNEGIRVRRIIPAASSDPPVSAAPVAFFSPFWLQVVCSIQVRSSQLWKRSAVPVSALTSGCAVSISEKTPPCATTAT